uniref:NADH:flavin oxidoreductase/NADH oxidase N-terminal domain-containing protein n=1 Tax=Globisporangium ultimum (strain ATCC 200006 / CBS 805.95 / DAOM BR144) TaxID=431595 RepID=K3WAB6_GLOUD
MSTSIKLFSPLTLGGKTNQVQLQHRVVMAPLTRLRSGEEGVPPPFAATYYSQRATEGGLLVTEGICISPTARGYFGTPGLFRDQQLQSWQHVTKAVHAKGGKIFAQLWHTGRVGHPLNQPNGVLPVSSSATPLDGVKTSAVTREGRKTYVTPRALEIDEIAGIVEDYRVAAVNAINSGFDGVELHAANGYLLEQFLCDGVNKRTDKYGGSIENRARFLFEALNAILTSVEPSRVGVRLSPFGTTFGCADSDPANVYSYVVKKLNDFGLAYLHVVEPRGRHEAGPLVPKSGVTAFFRPLYRGVLITASGYSRESAMQAVDDGLADLVAFGRDFIGTPDLVHRLKLGAPLNAYDSSTFYLGGEAGYTDYPFLGEEGKSTEVQA